MPLGTYSISRSLPSTTHTGASFTTAEKGSFTTNVRLRSLLVRAQASGTFTGKVVIFDNSTTPVLIYASAARPSMSVSAGVEFELPLDGNGFVLTAGIKYYIGVWEGTAGPYTIVSGGSAPSGSSWASTPTFSSWVKDTNTAWYGGPSSVTADPPTNSYQTSVNIGFTFDSPNLQPVLSNLTSTANMSGSTYNGHTFNWSYSDAESDTVAVREIEYKLTSSGTWSTYTQSSPGTSISLTTAQLTSPAAEYDIRIRVQDSAGSWSNYLTTVITAAQYPWVYGPQVTSATQSGPLQTNLIKGEFENASDISTWEFNSLFGTLVAPTSYVRSSVRAKTGTYSMEVTWPTGTASWVDVYLPNQTVIGQKYMLEADVYVPTGSPDVRFLMYPVPADFVYNTSSGKDSWVKITGSFTSGSTDYRVGVRTADPQPPTNGNKVWVDNVIFQEAYPVAGNYVVQVRTSDAVGFGPWSSSSSFVVSPLTNIKMKISGVFTNATTLVKQAGVWKQVPPTKTKSGGTF